MTKKNKIKKFDETAKRKFDDPWRYLFAFTIAIFLLLFGFLASYAITNFELDRVSSIQENIFYDFFEKQVTHDLVIDLDKCNLESYEEIGEVLDFQGSMFSQLETQLGKKDDEINTKKENYYLLQLSHYNLMKKLNEECSFERNFVLFFYSNDELEVDNSERLGRIITHLKAQDDSVMVYSFDGNSNSDLMKLVRSKFGIGNEVTILVNEDIKLTSVKDIDDILDVLK
ncbi:hypothetical protein HOD29_04560 [archaeon]|jgi:hypothetical protein|nr:hypothetical protein [archaeon]